MTIRSCGMAIGTLLLGATTSVAQEPPAIPAITGTFAIEGTVQKTYGALNTVLVKTVDGVEHLFHLGERTVLHGAAGGDALRGIDEGSVVVVHYTLEGDAKIAHEVDRVGRGGLKTTEGTVTKVDRIGKTISIRLAGGGEQTLRLTERAAADVGRDIDGATAGSTRVVVYFSDDTGHEVAHYFRRIS